MAEVHIWQPASGGDTLADASWDTLAPAGQAGEFGTFTGLPANLETVAINANGHVTPGTDHTYLFKTTLSTGPAIANEVLIGADVTEMARNLTSAIMKDGNEDRYGSPTVKHDAVTATSLAGVITLVSVHYGTDPNAIVLADAAANFTWDGAATSLSGGVTTWADGDEILINNNNHSALTSNLDWDTLLSPDIGIHKITRKKDNFSPIGSPGDPWTVNGKAGAGGISIFQCGGDGNVYFQGGSVEKFHWIQDGGFLSVLTGTVLGVYIKDGHCQCSADFNGFTGGAGAPAIVTGSNAILEILDSSKNPAGMIIAKAGRVENARDMIIGNWIIVGDGHVSQTGEMAGVGDGVVVVGNGSFSGLPATDSALQSGLFLISGNNSFADSEHPILAFRLIIGPGASFDRGPVSAINVVGEIDLREDYQ